MSKDKQPKRDKPTTNKQVAKSSQSPEDRADENRLFELIKAINPFNWFGSKDDNKSDK